MVFVCYYFFCATAGVEKNSPAECYVGISGFLLKNPSQPISKLITMQPEYTRTSKNHQFFAGYLGPKYFFQVFSEGSKGIHHQDTKISKGIQAIFSECPPLDTFGKTHTQRFRNRRLEGTYLARSLHLLPWLYACTELATHLQRCAVPRCVLTLVEREMTR